MAPRATHRIRVSIGTLAVGDCIQGSTGLHHIAGAPRLVAHDIWEYDCGWYPPEPEPPTPVYESYADPVAPEPAPTPPPQIEPRPHFLHRLWSLLTTPI